MRGAVIPHGKADGSNILRRRRVVPDGASDRHGHHALVAAQGFLSGKFRRDKAGSVDTKRTAMGVAGEKDYVVIDALCAVADEVGATAAGRAGMGPQPSKRCIVNRRAPAGPASGESGCARSDLDGCENRSAQRGVETGA